jgi:hypothetical protein
MAKRRITPEERAAWAEARRRLQERIDYHERRIVERAEQAARRQDRLHRLTFGLLGR